MFKAIGKFFHCFTLTFEIVENWLLSAKADVDLELQEKEHQRQQRAKSLQLDVPKD